MNIDSVTKESVHRRERKNPKSPTTILCAVGYKQPNCYTHIHAPSTLTVVGTRTHSAHLHDILRCQWQPTPTATTQVRDKCVIPFMFSLAITIKFSPCLNKVIFSLHQTKKLIFHQNLSGFFIFIDQFIVKIKLWKLCFCGFHHRIFRGKIDQYSSYRVFCSRFYSVLHRPSKIASTANSCHRNQFSIGKNTKVSWFS